MIRLKLTDAQGVQIQNALRRGDPADHRLLNEVLGQIDAQARCGSGDEDMDLYEDGDDDGEA